MIHEAVRTILGLLPKDISSEGITGFDSSEYPMPILTTFMGKKRVTTQAIGKMLSEVQESDVKEILKPILLAAELIEANTPDKQQFFVDDHELQSLIFMGAKWKAGWVLVLGGADQTKVISQLQANGFMVFTDLPDISGTRFIGSRETSPIYFLQMMVRYGLIWGRISPGDDHEMGHFLEKDLPGFVIINEDLPQLKYLVALGLMKLGAPAVVPSTFPFPYGNRIVADTPDDRVSRGMTFPNLRIRYYKGETISLPDFCNPVYANEKLERSHMVGGTQRSFMCLKPSADAERAVKVIGTPGNEIGIVVEVRHEKLSDDLTLIVEQTAVRALNFMSGVRAYVRDDMLCVELTEGRELDGAQIGQALYWGIRLQYPQLEAIKVSVIFEPGTLEDESARASQYRHRRREFIEGMTEENTEDWCVCTECRPFSLEHTCILTPDRVPMCASRSFAGVKAEAYFGTSTTPFQRQTETSIPLKSVFAKGRAIDLDRGEYEGCNRVYEEMTKGKLQRVYLHSLRDYPHTSCGCFQNLAFWIPEVGGIGIMSRNSKAMAPNGATWDRLANRAGGKQSDGIMGVSTDHIRSKGFLRGDGGIANVVWVDSSLYGKIHESFTSDNRVATEADAQTIEELRLFTGR